MQRRARTSTPNPVRRSRRTRRTRHSPFCHGLIVAALAAFVLLPAGATAQLAVTSVDPDGAFPGEPVVLSGSGFGQDPAALFCWVDTGAGGFAFEVTSAAGKSIDAVLGAVPAAATGAVKVWKGEAYALADRVLLSQGRLFAASDGEVFVGSAAAVGPAFSAFDSSPATFGSVTVHGTAVELRLDLDSLDLGGGGGPQRVRVTAVIETGSDSGSGTPQGNLVSPSESGDGGDGGDGGTVGAPRAAVVAGSSVDPSWAATLTVGFDAPPATVEALAAGLAEILEAQLGSVGLTARAEGTEIVVGHVLGIRAGFVDLAFE